MNKRKLWLAGLFSLIALMLNFQLALAHDTVAVGDYEIEYGWLNEPSIAGQENAIIINISNTSGGDVQPMEDVASLTVTVSYGGQSKQLTLQPLSEHTVGQFVAPILPTVPGEYTVIFGGKLGDTDVNNVEVQPEEVKTADTLRFPNVALAEQNTDLGMVNWLIYISLLIGLIALILSVMALRKTR